MAARQKALKIGAKECYIEDQRRVCERDLLPGYSTLSMKTFIYWGLPLPVPSSLGLRTVAQKECQFMFHGWTIKLI